MECSRRQYHRPRAQQNLPSAESRSDRGHALLIGLQRLDVAAAQHEAAWLSQCLLETCHPRVALTAARADFADALRALRIVADRDPEGIGVQAVASHLL